MHHGGCLHRFEQGARGMQHGLVGCGPRSCGKVQKGDAGRGTGLGFQLPATIIARPAQIDDGANALPGGGMYA